MQQRELGPGIAAYRMPAEWEPHEATWLSWPHNQETWPGCLDRVEAAFVEIVRALSVGEAVCINVQDEAHESAVRGRLRSGQALHNVRFHRCPTDDAWIRDYGAIGLCARNGDAPRMAVDFDYNAWGGKYPPYDRDREVARYMAQVSSLDLRSSALVLEGGSIDVNGDGLMLTTEQCLLNPNRNPGLSRGQIEAEIAKMLGPQQMLWLDHGIVGDDTDGHVDQLARFVSPHEVVVAVERNPEDVNFAALRANRDRLAEFQVADGRLEVIELPMPEPLFQQGQRLPASYANFYIANTVVLVPAFGCPQDAEAYDVLSQCFPGRSIAAIDCRAIIVGLGALHCLTQQLPAC